MGPETWDRGGGAGLAFLATCSTGAGTRVPCLRGGAQGNMDKNDDNPCPNEHHITLQARLLPQTAMSWGLCPRFIQEETEALRGKCSIPASLPHVLNGPVAPHIRAADNHRDRGNAVIISPSLSSKELRQGQVRGLAQVTQLRAEPGSGSPPRPMLALPREPGFLPHLKGRPITCLGLGSLFHKME